MIRIYNKFEPAPGRQVEVDTTSHGPFKGLSPFYLGPCVWSEPGNGSGRLIRGLRAPKNFPISDKSIAYSF